MEIISKNTKDTEQIAKDFLKYLMSKVIFDITYPACVVGLSGDLGTGKTTFVQFIALNLGIKNRVNSPTFVIIKKYTLAPIRTRWERRNKFKNLFHIDAYRLKNYKELINLGWKEIISNPENLIFIEWPENVKKAMPKKYHKIFIKHLPIPNQSRGQVGIKENYRKFKIKSPH